MTLPVAKRVKKRRERQPEITTVGEKPMQPRVSGRSSMHDWPNARGRQWTDSAMSGSQPALIANL